MKGVCGLQNIGNTCYLNAIVQCLRHCNDYSRYIFSNNYKQNFKGNELEENVISSWHTLLYNLWSNNGSESYNPIDFIRKFLMASQHSNYSTFVSFQQNDVDEFLTNLINIMHNAVSTKISYTLSGTPENEADKHAITAYKRWKGFFENDYSIFVKHFYSQYITKIKCNNCSNVSFSYDPVLIVHLPIPDKTPCSIYDCFDLLTNEQSLDEDNQWKCDKCNKTTCASVSNKFWDTSKYLIILLKRYNNNRKNNTGIDIPLDMNINKYAINYKKDNFKYSLFSVCHHDGDLNGGHYYASCKTNEEWYIYNDANATRVTTPNLDNAYCLFYKLLE